MKRIIFYLTVLALLSSCSWTPDRLPYAEFSIAKDSPCVVPCTIFIENNSLNATSLKWDFGDGQKDTITQASIKSLSYTYYEVSDSKGYNIKLTAYNEQGESHEFVRNRIVYPPVDTPMVFWRCGDTLIDNRDGKKYRTVWIDYKGGNDLNLPGQCWMAQNLNFGSMVTGGTDVSNDTCSQEHCKYCWKNIETSCDLNGALYTPRMFNKGVEQVGICPKGWHIPTDEEWQKLEKSYNMPEEEIEKFADADVRGTGLGLADRFKDPLGLNIKLSGLYSKFNKGCNNDSDSCFSNTQNDVYFWSSTIAPKNGAFIKRRFTQNSDGIGRDDGGAGPDNHKGFCLRCLKN